jgi:hypothetical protein
MQLQSSLYHGVHYNLYIATANLFMHCHTGYHYQEIAYLGTEDNGFVMIEQNVNVTEITESNGRHLDWLMNVCSTFT